MTQHYSTSNLPWVLRAIAFLSKTCGAIASAMILLAVIITCQMVWVRYINNESTVWQTEAVVYLMIGATLIGLPYVQQVGGHVNVDLLPRLLSPNAARWLSVFTLIVAILVLGSMLFYGYELWHVALERGWRSDTVWGVPLWIPYISLPIGFGLFVLQLLADLYALLLGHDPLTVSDRRH